MKIIFEDIEYFFELYFENNKTYLFLISRNEIFDKRNLENILTILFNKYSIVSKTDIADNKIYLYLNKFCFSRYIESKKLYILHLNFSSRIFIENKEIADEHIIRIYKRISIDHQIFFNTSITEYRIFLRSAKVENRLLLLKRNKKLKQINYKKLKFFENDIVNIKSTFTAIFKNHLNRTIKANT